MTQEPGLGAAEGQQQALGKPGPGGSLNHPRKGFGVGLIRFAFETLPQLAVPKKGVGDGDGMSAKWMGEGDTHFRAFSV